MSLLSDKFHGLWPKNAYPEPVYTGWSIVHWDATVIPRVDPLYTGIPLSDPEDTCRVHWNTTGKLFESAPHWNATGETLIIEAYTGTPPEGL